MSLSISTLMKDTIYIESGTILLTVIRINGNHKFLSGADRTVSATTQEEVLNLFRKATITLALAFEVHYDDQIQLLKFVLAVSASSEEQLADQYRPRVVSVPRISVLRRSIGGNTPTVLLSAVCMIELILSISKKLSTNERNVVLCVDVPKTFTRGLETKRFIVYQPPPELCKAYSK